MLKTTYSIPLQLRTRVASFQEKVSNPCTETSRKTARTLVKHKSFNILYHNKENYFNPHCCRRLRAIGPTSASLPGLFLANEAKQKIPEESRARSFLKINQLMQQKQTIQKGVNKLRLRRQSYQELNLLNPRLAYLVSEVDWETLQLRRLG